VVLALRIGRTACEGAVGPSAEVAGG